MYKFKAYFKIIKKVMFFPVLYVDFQGCIKSLYNLYNKQDYEHIFQFNPFEQLPKYNVSYIK